MKIKTIQFGNGRLSESGRKVPGITNTVVELTVGKQMVSNTVPITISHMELDRTCRMLTVKAVETATGKPWRQWSERKDAEGKMPKEYECDGIQISVDEFCIFADDEQPNQGQQQKGK